MNKGSRLVEGDKGAAPGCLFLAFWPLTFP